MTKRSHRPNQLAIASDLASGAWLRARKNAVAELTAGLTQELRRFPKGAATRFAGVITKTVVLSEVMQTVFAEDRRVRYLEEMIAAGQRFLKLNERTGVLFHPIIRRFDLPPKEAEEHRDAQIADTSALREARKQAFKAVSLYLGHLNEALETARRRRRGEKRTADEVGFFAGLARKYAEALGERPTSTPGGTFSNIVTLVRKYQTGEAPENVSRIVRAALKDI